jgi:hypothetical protein
LDMGPWAAGSLERQSWGTKKKRGTGVKFGQWSLLWVTWLLPHQGLCEAWWSLTVMSRLSHFWLHLCEQSPFHNVRKIAGDRVGVSAPGPYF